MLPGFRSCIIEEFGGLINYLRSEPVRKIFTAFRVLLQGNNRHRKSLGSFGNIPKRQPVLLDCRKTDILVPHPGRYILDRSCILPDCLKTYLRGWFLDMADGETVLPDGFKTYLRGLFLHQLAQDARDLSHERNAPFLFGQYRNHSLIRTDVL